MPVFDMKKEFSKSVGSIMDSFANGEINKDVAVLRVFDTFITFKKEQELTNAVIDFFGNELEDELEDEDEDEDEDESNVEICIIQNAIECPDGVILNSIHRHDYQTHDGYMVDGGKSYFRGSIKENSIDLRLTSSDSFEDIKNKLVWGTYGKNGDEPLHYLKLVNCETDHLKAILEIPNLNDLHLSVVESLLKDREQS